MELTEGRRTGVRVSGILFLGCFLLHILDLADGLTPGTMGTAAAGITAACLFIPAIIGLIGVWRITAAAGFGLCAVCTAVDAWPTVAWWLTGANGGSSAAVFRLLLGALLPVLWMSFAAIRCLSRKWPGTVSGWLSAAAAFLNFAYYFSARFRWDPFQAYNNWCQVLDDWLLKGTAGSLQLQYIENIAMAFGTAATIFLAAAMQGSRPAEDTGRTEEQPAAGRTEASRVIAELTVLSDLTNRGILSQETFALAKTRLLTPFLPSVMPAREEEKAAFPAADDLTEMIPAQEQTEAFPASTPPADPDPE